MATNRRNIAEELQQLQMELRLQAEARANEAKLTQEFRRSLDAMEVELNNAESEQPEEKHLAELNNSIGPNGETCLHRAVKTNTVQEVEALLRAKVNPNVMDNDKKTPLLLCIENHHSPDRDVQACCRMLLAYGANPHSSIRFTQHPSWDNNNIQINYSLSLYKYAKRCNKPVFEELKKHCKSKP